MSNRVQSLIARRAELSAAQVVLELEYDRIEQEGITASARLDEIRASEQRIVAIYNALPALSLEQWRTRQDHERRATDALEQMRRIVALAKASAENVFTREVHAAEIARIDAALAQVPSADIAAAGANAN